MINKLFLLCGSLALYLSSVALMPLYRKYALSKGILDIQNARSSHQGITPRGGGVVFLSLWAIAFALGGLSGLFTPTLLLTFLPGTVLVSILGYWDDRFHLTPKLRLVGQTLAALLFLASLGNVETLHFLHPDIIFNFSSYPWLLWGAIIIAIVWSINLFNFMDGIDGIASIEALFVLGIGGFIFWLGGAATLALLAWSMVVVVAGFLVWNWPKATLFMGDVGSYGLGFLIAAFAIAGDIWYDIPLLLWIILYGLFWFDATVTLLRRLWLKQHWATAHRDHAYQRLVQSGFTQPQVLFLITLVNVLLGCLALWGYYNPSKLPWAFVAALVLLLAWYLFTEKRIPHKRGPT